MAGTYSGSSLFGNWYSAPLGEIRERASKRRRDSASCSREKRSSSSNRPCSAPLRLFFPSLPSPLLPPPFSGRIRRRRRSLRASSHFTAAWRASRAAAISHSSPSSSSCTAAASRAVESERVRERYRYQTWSLAGAGARVSWLGVLPNRHSNPNRVVPSLAVAYGQVPRAGAASLWRGARAAS